MNFERPKDKREKDNPDFNKLIESDKVNYGRFISDLKQFFLEHKNVIVSENEDDALTFNQECLSLKSGDEESHINPAEHSEAIAAWRQFLKDRDIATWKSLGIGHFLLDNGEKGLAKHIYLGLEPQEHAKLFEEEGS